MERKEQLCKVFKGGADGAQAHSRALLVFGSGRARTDLLRSNRFLFGSRTFHLNQTAKAIHHFVKTLADSLAVPSYPKNYGIGAGLGPQAGSKASEGIL